MNKRLLFKTLLFFTAFSIGINNSLIYGWSWSAADQAVLPSLQEDYRNEVTAYRQQVGNGISLHERTIILDKIVRTYKPLGINVADIETELERLSLQEKQQALRTAEVHGQTTTLYDRGVAEYKKGEFSTALVTFQETERLSPQDNAIRDIRIKLESIVPIIESETGLKKDSQLIRLAVVRYLENDPKRAMNALLHARDEKVNRSEMVRLIRLIETNYPEIEAPKLTPGISLINRKLQLSLEAIYDGRYLSAISECTDVLDLEPENVLALTRLGSAYYAMNEREKAKQIWTKALQIDPKNDVLRKFLYGQKGASRVEASR